MAVVSAHYYPVYLIGFPKLGAGLYAGTEEQVGAAAPAKGRSAQDNCRMTTGNTVYTVVQPVFCGTADAYVAEHYNCNRGEDKKQ